MRRWLPLALGILAFPAEARDYGVAGQTFVIVEPDLLATIEARLRRLEASGGIARANAGFARAAEARVRRPAPVGGLSAATANRGWTFDPAVTLERDVRDAKGNVLARSGQAVNPLDFVTLRGSLVFIDGDDPGQLAWALARFRPLDDKIILVGGAPLDAMSRWRRRFYFDQGGRLTTKFGITHVPAVATQAGKVLHLTEVALKPQTLP